MKFACFLGWRDGPWPCPNKQHFVNALREWHCHHLVQLLSKLLRLNKTLDIHVKRYLCFTSTWVICFLCISIFNGQEFFWGGSSPPTWENHRKTWETIGKWWFNGHFCSSCVISQRSSHVTRGKPTRIRSCQVCRVKAFSIGFGSRVPPGLPRWGVGCSPAKHGGELCSDLKWWGKHHDKPLY